MACENSGAKWSEIVEAADSSIGNEEQQPGASAPATPLASERAAVPPVNADERKRRRSRSRCGGRSDEGCTPCSKHPDYSKLRVSVRNYGSCKQLTSVFSAEAHPNELTSLNFYNEPAMFAPDSYDKTTLPKLTCVREGNLFAGSVRLTPCRFLLRGSFVCWIEMGYNCVRMAAANVGLTDVTISHSQTPEQIRHGSQTCRISFAVRASGTSWVLPFLQTLETVVSESDPHPRIPGKFKVTFIDPVESE
ncbi:hypothetical protein [Pteropox virus]|uniref:Uncharacterized protein n=1 Tax=Pteropox virus TaxID=1873698 RepID=A0A1B1MRD0_9POXV|nr:hypothetical protein [Pteropox virus]ANS71085.1 hypothetical protein [Pteropox virus]